MNWASILGNVASGGVLGLLGSVASTGLAIWQTREQRRARAEDRAHELAMMDAQARHNLQMAEQNLRETEAKAISSGFDASQAADANAHGASDRVQDFKALTRHIVVYLLIGLSGTIYFFKASPEQQTMMAGVIVQLTTMAISWLYGQRQILQGVTWISTAK